MRTIIPVRKRQRGTVLVMAAFAAAAVFGFMGVALNVSHAYDLKSELQNMADAAALSGAKALNGTAAGIAAAVAAAQATAASNRFNFSQPPALGSGNISFAASPDAATWLSVAAAQAAPAGLLFIRVDTGPQTSIVGSVVNFMNVMGVGAPLSTSAVAVAGRFSLGISPMAICALETTKYSPLAHAGLPPELKEFGFRRGMSYNIMDINPLGGAPQKFMLNPVDVPPAPGDPSACDPAHSSANKVAPYMCGGTVSIITTLPGYVYVNTGFSSSLQREINSRFNDYSGGSVCTPGAAPPDANVQEYKAPSPPAPSAPSNANGVPRNWMSPAPTQQSVTLQSSPRIPVSPFPGAADYGVLWSYNSAVQYAAAPPGGGYVPYGTADWPQLYPTSAAPTPTAPAYPSGAPYQQTGAPYFTPPATNGPGVRDRRVLNIAIVDCSTLSAAGGSSCKTIQVLGIGRFFMTVKSNLPSSLNTEFAGLAPDASLTADIKLYH